MEIFYFNADEPKQIKALSKLATDILREYYDPLLGIAQNLYMTEKFQSVHGILDHMKRGAVYGVLALTPIQSVEDIANALGFFAYEFKEDYLYISKFYLRADARGKGYSHPLMDEFERVALEHNLPALRLNVNKYNPTIDIYEHLGFRIIESEVNDIGKGYVMDDYVMEKRLS